MFVYYSTEFPTKNFRTRNAQLIQMINISQAHSNIRSLATCGHIIRFLFLFFFCIIMNLQQVIVATSTTSFNSQLPPATCQSIHQSVLLYYRPWEFAPLRFRLRGLGKQMLHIPICCNRCATHHSLTCDFINITLLLTSITLFMFLLLSAIFIHFFLRRFVYSLSVLPFLRCVTCNCNYNNRHC